MNNTEKIEKPTGSLSPVQMCQAGHIIYPVRLALSKTYLDNISTSSALPVLPKNFAEPGKDYETRQLRTGYIYILMLDVNSSSREELVSARANNLYNWLIYQYTTKDISDKNSATMYQFLRSPYGNLNSYWDRPGNNIGQPYICLPPEVSAIDIMYSETALAPEILELLAKDEGVRKSWMQKFFLNNEEGLIKKVDTVDKIKEYVTDFNEQQKNVAQEEDNARRHIFIGKRPEYISIIEQINHCHHVHVVALKDPVGTVRDLSGYHHYLAENRQKVMRKYEYAINTAQIIHNYVAQKYIKDRNNYNAVLASGSAGFGIISPKRIIDIYASLNIQKEHLTPNGNQDVFAALKTEFDFENDIKGHNSVHKMASIPTLYGKAFKNVVNIFTRYLNSSEIKHRLDTLSSILLANKTPAIAENWCLFMQSILHGLDESSYGRHAVIAALCPKGKNFTLPETAQKDDEAVSALKNILGNIETILNTLKEIALAEEFSLSGYDSFIKTVIDKMSVHDTYRKKGEQTYTNLVLSLYGKSPLNSPGSAPKSSTYNELFNAMPFEGLKKTLFFSQLLGAFWGDNNAKTEAGKLAQDPGLLAANMLLDEYAAKGSILERARKGEKFPKFSSNAARLKYVLMSMNTFLAGVGALFAYGNWQEAHYKGDDTAMYAVLLQGTGGITFEGAIGALGFFALQTPTPLILRLMMLARVGTAVGALLLLAGLITSAFERTDMEIWIENGFWGNSPNYWGAPLNAYQWITEKRLKNFHKQFENSEFIYEDNTQLKSSEIVKLYQIEMQRYFSIGTEIEFSMPDKYTILVEYPGIYTQKDAETLKLHPVINVTYPVEQVNFYDPPVKKFILESHQLETEIVFEEVGKAIIKLTPKQSSLTLICEPLRIPRRTERKNYNNLLSLELKIHMEDYRGSKIQKSSKTKKFIFNK